MRNRARQAGASAIEVMIIVGIVLILAAILVPNLTQATTSYNIQIAAAALEQQLNRCRQEAVRANVPMTIKVSAHTTAIDLDRDDPADFTDETVTSISDAATIELVEPTSGVVTYSSRGEMPFGSSPVFNVVVDNRYRVVSIDPRGAVEVGPEQAR